MPRRPAIGDEQNPLGLPTIPRTVRARTRAMKPRRIVCHYTREGEHFAIVPATAEVLTGGAEIVERLARHESNAAPPWACATLDAGALFLMLQEHGPSVPGFVARGSIREARTYQRTGRLSRSATVTATLTDFGWTKRKGARVLVLDPCAFTDEPAEDAIGATPAERADPLRLLMRLALWAGDLLGWCSDAGVELRPGRGGIAAQFLTDDRWWPASRRKVPKRLNADARPELPGNHYRLYSAATHPSAVELDQRSAHHETARRVTFTDADTLHGFGRTGARATTDAPLLCSVNDPRWHELADAPGVLWLRVEVEPAAVTRATPLAQFAGAGVHVVPVWSAELPDVMAEPGVRVLGAVGGIVSWRTSDALNGYAAWALGQLENAAGNRRRMRWLKPLLLAVYGTMAQSAKPVVMFSTEPTARSSPELVALGARVVEVHVARSSRAVEPRYVNVLDRGIIEAETRAETIRVARAIEERTAADDAQERAELVALYADSVLVAPAGARAGARASDGAEHLEWIAGLEKRAHAAGRGAWRSTPLTELTMLAINAYKSDEVTKRPGVARVRAPT